VYLVGEVGYQRIQSASLLAPAEVFEGMRESDGVLEVSVSEGKKVPREKEEGAYWLSLSTRSPKLSLPSI
jgi:hypothetical protein